MTDPISAERRKVWPLGGYAPGGYSCTCVDCGDQFVGDKRSNQCLDCAIVWANKTITELQSRRQSPAGVDVKPTEWRHYPDAFPPMWVSQNAPFGHYSIEEAAGSDSPTFDVFHPTKGRIANVDGLPEAKAAAQADYERRILSCLSVEPAEVEPVGYTSAGELERLSEWFEHADAVGVVGQPRGVRTIPLYASPTKDVTITDEMVNEALSVWRDYEFSEPPVRDFSRMRATLTAALSSEAHNG